MLFLHSEMLSAYWVSNNNLSSSGEPLCSDSFVQKPLDTFRRGNTALIITGDFLVRQSLASPSSPLHRGNLGKS